MGPGGIGLQGLRQWPKPEQEQARVLLPKWEHLFTCSDLDLGKTALIKHKIEVTDWMPFKECCQCIPPHMYDNTEGLYLGDPGYWCHPEVAQSMG